MHMCVLQGMATVAAVDCDSDANKALCSQFGVKSFPSKCTLQMWGALYASLVIVCTWELVLVFENTLVPSQ